MVFTYCRVLLDASLIMSYVLGNATAGVSAGGMADFLIIR
jgi:hypothetical protein